MILRSVFPSFACCSLLAVVALTTACSTDDSTDFPDAGDDHDVASEVDTDDTDPDDADPLVELRLDEITPDDGAVEGGTEVTLGGQGFEDGLEVYFGAEPADDVERMGSLSAQAVTPPSDAEGPVDVTVENPDGRQSILDGGFHYVDETPEGDPPQDCNVQFPVIAEQLDVSQPSQLSLYARIFEPDVTDRRELPPGLTAQALVIAEDALPTDNIDHFKVVDAHRNDAYIDDDFEEFEATIDLDADSQLDTTIDSAGTYAYAFRFSLDGGQHWTICDLGGPVAQDDQVDPARFGALEVFENAPNRVHFCATWPDELTGPSDGEGPTIDMEVYEAGVTDGESDDFDGELLEVEAGFGPPGANPTLGYLWTSLDYQGPVVDNPNNAHYAGPLYAAGDAPDSGDYQAMTRARIDGEQAWRYCNTDDSQSDFAPGLVTEVSIDSQ